MKRNRWLAVLCSSFLLAGIAQAQVVEEFFSDDFSGPTRDDTKWRDSIYLDNTASLDVVDGRVFFSRNTLVPDVFQQVQWDARFTRRYNNDDYLQIGATVRIPHKIRSGAGVYSLGIGLVSGGAQFVELVVEDSIDGRLFGIWLEDLDTGFSDYILFDAPQNVGIFDLVITYTAKNDTLAFYWSIPGVSKLFRIGRILNFQQSVGGVTPRRIQPYVIGLLEETTLPPAWRVTLDNFYAFREDAL